MPTTTKVPKFLRHLYTILNNEDKQIIAWSHDGSYFQIYHVQALEEQILGKYFKHTKFASFQRQLNTFGFRKWTKTRANVCTFSHNMLVRCALDDLVTVVQRWKLEQLEFKSEQVTKVASHKRSRFYSDDALGLSLDDEDVTDFNMEIDYKKLKGDETDCLMEPFELELDALSITGPDLLTLDCSFEDNDWKMEMDCIEPISVHTEFEEDMSLTSDEWEVVRECLTY